MIRTALTVLAALAAFTLPARAEINIKEITTPGGIEAWLVEEHAIPFIALELKFRGGAGLDTPDKLGMVHLMTVLLEEGAGDRDAREFAKARDTLASSISFSVDHDTISVSTRFLTENTEETMALLRDALTAPQFNDEALERVRAQVLSVLQSDLKDPEELANLYYYRDIFGDHPYAFPMNGTLETVAALTRDDLVGALEKAITRDRVYVGAVGDITAEELSTLLDNLLEGLPESGPDLPQMAEPDLPGGVRVYEFETPQSVVRFAQPGIDRDHPDFFAAYVLNHILGGGGFESRLMSEVREKRGLTYGVYSYLSIPDYANLWAGGTASANDRVAETIRVIREEWTRMRDEGVTEEELRDAQTYLTGAYPLRFDGNGPIARIAVSMQLDDLPTDYIRTRNDKVNAVTLEQINRVARERLDPDKLTFFVVGQPEGLDTTTQ
ncbi:insulinase family protein [Roseovarius faecimaris]|uniref:Insulinase family protein n=1 Tax=Roseovarius faecimaris TaxID=2494550 RepID=A0A6I6IRV2_9RHOB|nr:pitrilysin family protein [Roseovarius faecimaris]QGX99789.1 insulinase family protein [Roseovarius faecimaris]